jgi:hypothetical protein
MYNTFYEIVQDKINCDDCKESDDCDDNDKNSQEIDQEIYTNSVRAAAAVNSWTRCSGRNQCSRLQ